MKKLYLLLTAFIITAVSAFAQQKGAIKFDVEAYDFGQIKEEGGPAKHEFSFTNTGNLPITLTDVKASCGCTTPKWDKEPVAPGKRGSIIAEYNPMNRPGPFTKSITVKAKVDTSSVEDIKVLTIKGEVVPRVKGPADWYPTKVGNLRFSTNHVAFGNIKNNQTNTSTFIVYNDWTKPVAIKSITAPPHITFEPTNKVLQPKDSVKITVKYNAAVVNDYGFLHEQTKMTTDDSTDADKTIYVSSTVEENFTKEDSLSGPKIEFTTINHDFGKIKAGEVVETKFEFKNTGKKELVIRKTKASCGCTAGQPEKMKLKPGEVSSIKVTYNSAGKNGKESKTVTVISNSPERSSQVLTIQAEVEPVPQNRPATPQPPNSPK